MHDYGEIQINHGRKVSQTIDSPIKVFDFWELSDVFTALLVIMVFGVVIYAWWPMFFLLVFFLGVGPVIKSRNNRGVFLHWPYRHLKMSLPSLMNPGGKKKYSD